MFYIIIMSSYTYKDSLGITIKANRRIPALLFFLYKNIKMSPFSKKQSLICLMAGHKT